MIDLDELERKREAAEAPTSRAEIEYLQCLLVAAPELIAMARRLEWIVEKAIEWNEVEHKAFVIQLSTLRGPDVYAAIDAAMQEQSHDHAL